MTQQIFDNSSKFSAPVMTLDRSDLPKQGGGSLVAHENKMALTNRICTFYLTGCLYMSSSSYVINLICHIKLIKARQANMPVFRQTCSSHKIGQFSSSTCRSKYDCHIKIASVDQALNNIIIQNTAKRKWTHFFQHKITYFCRAVLSYGLLIAWKCFSIKNCVCRM